MPALDTLMSTCPSLNTLKIDLRMSTLALSPHPQKINMDKLTKLSVGLYLTKAAFEWLWTNAANLEVQMEPITTLEFYYTKKKTSPCRF